jgi:hypothetical protein
MRNKLLNLGAGQQFTIRPGDDCDLYLEYGIVDAKFYGVASKESLKKQYSAKMWLVAPERTVKYREIIQEQSSSMGVLPTPKLSFEKSTFKGKTLFKKEIGVGVGFKKPGGPSSFGKVYQYDFDVRKIRDPVKAAVESEGWKFEQIIMDYKPSVVVGSRFCANCGSQMTPDSLFCSNCGQKIT